MNSVPAKKFACDRTLGRLAKWLRILGYDTIFWNSLDDRGFLETCISEDRILLTRNTAMLKSIGKNNKSGQLTFLFIELNDVMSQVRHVIEAFGLIRECHLNRCAECNVALSETLKKDVEGLVPEYVYETHERFMKCSACGRYYWEGSHVKRMTTRISSLFEK